MKPKCLLILFFLVPIISSAVLKTTITSGNWSNPSVWSPSGVPSIVDKIYINNSILLDQNFTTSDTIFVNNVLSISKNKILTLNSPGTMVLVNNANYNGRIGTVANGGKIIGNYIFQKWVTRCDGYSTYGSPFTVPTTSFDWYHCFQCMGPTWSNIYSYDETATGLLNIGYYDNIGSNFVRGRGFFYWFSNYSGGQNFARQITIKGSTDFATTFDFNVTNTSSSGGPINDGYNFISNPYPGTIDWLTGSWMKQKVNDAIYVWNSCTGSYATYVSRVGVNGGSRYISSMQGFWIQTNNNNPRLNVKSDAIVTASSNLLRTDSISDAVFLVLRLKLNNDEIAIRLDSNSTSDLDSLTDAKKFFSDSSKICSSIHLATIDYAINAIKDSSNVIPIKVKGGGLLTFNGVTSFFNQYVLYLKDLETNAFQPITEGMQYIFSDTSKITFNQRFEVHFVKVNTVGIKNNWEITGKIRYNDENIFITIPKEFGLPVNIKMFDLFGREVYSSKFNDHEIIIPKKDFPVILDIFNEQERFVKKVF